MTADRDDEIVMAELERAGALYDDYLRIAEVSRIPTAAELETPAVPQLVDLPLTLSLRLG